MWLDSAKSPVMNLPSLSEFHLLLNRNLCKWNESVSVIFAIARHDVKKGYKYVSYRPTVQPVGRTTLMWLYLCTCTYIKHTQPEGAYLWWQRIVTPEEFNSQPCLGIPLCLGRVIHVVSYSLMHLCGQNCLLGGKGCSSLHDCLLPNEIASDMS